MTVLETLGWIDRLVNVTNDTCKMDSVAPKLGGNLSFRTYSIKRLH